MPDMISRVAQAIDMVPSSINIAEQRHAEARAAIKAMREPTDEMVEAVNRKERQMLRGPAGARLHYSVAFRAMIDAALETDI